MFLKLIFQLSYIKKNVYYLLPLPPREEDQEGPVLEMIGLVGRNEGSICRPMNGPGNLLIC